MYNVTRYDPQGLDKVMHMHSVSSTVENGFVYIPVEAAWRSEYLDEMAAFPNGKYDDQVDSISQALDWSRTGAGTIRLTYAEYVLEQHEARQHQTPASLAQEEQEALRMIVRSAKMFG